MLPTRHRTIVNKYVKPIIERRRVIVKLIFLVFKDDLLNLSFDLTTED